MCFPSAERMDSGTISAGRRNLGQLSKIIACASGGKWEVSGVSPNRNSCECQTGRRTVHAARAFCQSDGSFAGGKSYAIGCNLLGRKGIRQSTRSWRACCFIVFCWSRIAHYWQPYWPVYRAGRESTARLYLKVLCTSCKRETMFLPSCRQLQVSLGGF